MEIIDKRWKRIGDMESGQVFEENGLNYYMVTDERCGLDKVAVVNLYTGIVQVRSAHQRVRQMNIDITIPLD